MTKTLKLALTLTVLLFIGCTVNQEKDPIEASETHTNSRLLKICPLYNVLATNTYLNPQKPITVIIGYTPVTTNTTSPNYQARRTIIRNQLLEINPNIVFEELSEDSDLLKITNQILDSIQDYLCDAYTNQNLSEIEAYSKGTVCYNSNLSEANKQAIRNDKMINENLILIQEVSNGCEIWTMKGCCKMGVTGGGVDLGNDDFTYEFIQ